MQNNKSKHKSSSYSCLDVFYWWFLFSAKQLQFFWGSSVLQASLRSAVQENRQPGQKFWRYQWVLYHHWKHLLLSILSTCLVLSSFRNPQDCQTRETCWQWGNCFNLDDCLSLITWAKLKVNCFGYGKTLCLEEPFNIGFCIQTYLHVQVQVTIVIFFMIFLILSLG